MQTEFQKKVLNENYKINAHLITSCTDILLTENNPIDTDVLWVGSIKKIKQPGKYIQLCQMLPDYKFRMLGAKPLSSGFENVTKVDGVELSCVSNLDYVGFVPYHEVNPHFKRCRVYVNTSESEGFPNTFLQAWANGVPTVSFFDPGVDWAGEKVGFVVSTMGEMKEVVDRLMVDEDFYCRNSALSYDYVKNNCRVDVATSKYLDLFSA